MPAVPFLTARPVSLRSDLARSQKERNVAWPIPNLRKKRAREDSQERADSAAWLGATDAPLPSLDPPPGLTGGTTQGSPESVGCGDPGRCYPHAPALPTAGELLPTLRETLSGVKTSISPEVGLRRPRFERFLVTQ